MLTVWHTPPDESDRGVIWYVSLSALNFGAEPSRVIAYAWRERVTGGHLAWGRENHPQIYRLE